MVEWCPDWIDRSPVFSLVSEVWHRTDRSHWPGLGALNEALAACGGATSVSGAAIRFVPQDPKEQSLDAHYETRIYRRGEVQTRLQDWHDFFNALTWMLFPRAKAVTNARHYEALCRHEESLYTRPRRSTEEDILTLFHENGVAVVSSDPSLLSMMREFQWEALFWERREEVRQKMTFFLFGHALYEKFLTPYVGLTGHSVLYDVDDSFFAASPKEQLAMADQLMADDFGSETPSIQTTRDFAPFPMLGFPGLVPESEDRAYYHNTRYFRPGRRGKR